MTEPEQKLTPATPEDLAESLSFALRFQGRKSQHDSDRLNADIVAKRLVRYLDTAGYADMDCGRPVVWIARRGAGLATRRARDRAARRPASVGAKRHCYW